MLAHTHHVVNIVIIAILAMLRFVSFHNVTCYTNSLLSCIHVNTTQLLNVTCTLVHAKCDIMEFYSVHDIF
jgi:hypothetical protein